MFRPRAYDGESQRSLQVLLDQRHPVWDRVHTVSKVDPFVSVWNWYDTRLASMYRLFILRGWRLMPFSPCGGRSDLMRLSRLSIRAQVHAEQDKTRTIQRRQSPCTCPARPCPSISMQAIQGGCPAGPETHPIERSSYCTQSRMWVCPPDLHQYDLTSVSVETFLGGRTKDEDRYVRMSRPDCSVHRAPFGPFPVLTSYWHMSC